MKRAIATILLLSTFIASAYEKGEGGEVWIDGASFYKSLAHKKQSTIYFKEWSGYVSQFLNDDSYYVALQLDGSLDPFPDDGIELPSLQSIAAIANDAVLNEYLIFLERFGRTKGVNYLILPDTSGLTIFEKEVVQKAAARSPYYFLNKHFLNHSIPSSKRAFAQGDGPTIWIADQDENLNKIKKWSARFLKAEQFDFIEGLRRARENEFLPIYDLPQFIRRGIVEEATFAIDKAERLPLTSNRAVTYLGTDERLMQLLSKYVKVLQARSIGVPAIVDHRHSQHLEPEVGDIVLTKKMLQKDYDISQIVLPTEVDGEENLITHMLFGSAGMVGRHVAARRIDNPQFLGYADHEWNGMDPSQLERIDTLAAHAIRRFATPGMQVAVAYKGNVVFEKSYGFYTYDSLRQVENSTLYDVASLTKVAATLPAIALLIEQGKLNLDDSISRFLPEFSGSNKSHITIRQLLAHNAGLRSYIPFWSMMMDGDLLDAFYYRTPEDQANDIRTYGLEPHPVLLDTLRSFIVKSDLIKNREKYNYSDLGFMILHLVVEAASGVPFDEYLMREFYHPMGLTRTVFNPRKSGFSFEEIAPTEFDQRYRNYQVWGEVHDRNAAVFGGVSGHAGLFSTASDLAKLMSMFLNDGYYGGRSYLSEEVLNQFNKRYFNNNRRGLGWDKKDGDRDAASTFASDQSFGHTGFTGTMVWADPETDLIFVFLSNRVYPDAENWRLGQLNTRTDMHDVVYKSIKSHQ